MKTPAEWMGPNGHLLQEPWVPSFFSDGLAALTTELEAAAPPGLADRRTGSAMHDLLDKGLQGGPGVGVTLTRTGALLFSESPETTAGIADQVITSIKDLVAAAVGGPVSGSIPIPELGLTAMVHDGGAPSPRLACG